MNNEDLNLVKERLLSQEKYKQPHYFHSIRLMQFSDYKDFDFEIYPDEKDIDRHGDLAYSNQSWELSFRPNSVTITIKEGISAGDTCRLLEKAIDDIKANKISLVTDHKQKDQLLNSTKATLKAG